MERVERVALRVAYQGARYSGWQRQPNAATVQERLEGAIAKLLLEERMVVVGASRTDAGVHARAQWAHLDLPRSFPLDGLVLGTNSYLPPDIRVLSARQVSSRFHAQRSALWKRYRYRLFRHRIGDPLEAPQVARHRGDLDHQQMTSAARLFEGRHDFSAFAKAGGSHDDPVREIHRSRVTAMPQEFRFEFEGNGFLRGMVRAMVGTLVEVGIGRREVASVRELLAPGHTRSEAGAAAPANGLVLEHIQYPSDAWGSARFDGGAESI